MKEKGLMELVDDCEQVNEPYTKTDENMLRAEQLKDLGFLKVAEDIVTQVKTKDKLGRITDYGYIKITDEQIAKFLDKKVELYNAEHEIKPSQIDPDESVSARRRWFDFGKRIQSPQMPMPPLEQRDFGNPLRYTQRSMIADMYDRMMRDSILLGFGGYTGGSSLSRDTCDRGKSTGIGRFEWNETHIQAYKTIPPQDVLDKLAEHKAREVFDYFTIASIESIPDPLLLGRVNDVKDRFFIAQWGKDITLDDII